MKIEIDARIYASVWTELALVELYLNMGERSRALHELRRALAMLPSPHRAAETPE